MHTGERTFELAASDYRSRLQWLSALQLAVAHSGEGGYQRMLAARRRQQRDAERMRAKEETLRRNSQLVDMQVRPLKQNENYKNIFLPFLKLFFFFLSQLIYCEFRIKIIQIQIVNTYLSFLIIYFLNKHGC